MNKTWDWLNISFTKCNLKLIQENPNLPWNYSFISSSRDATWDIIIANPTIPWKWSMVSINPNITCEIIQANPEYPWNWYSISLNTNITLEFIKSNPDKLWNYADNCTDLYSGSSNVRGTLFF